MIHRNTTPQPAKSLPRVFARLVATWLGLALLTPNLIADSPKDDARPNIVFILADDLGYGDLGCYGHPDAKTPRIDQLAAEGVRFTQHYSNGPECSPTRTAFLTGRYQQSLLGLECAIGTGNVGRYDDAIKLANERNLGLAAEATVIPGQLKKSGYACGIFGKWHLGYEPHFNPMIHGWDSFFGYLGGNVHYFNHRETSDLHVLFDGVLPVHREGYMTKLITDASIEFIENESGPFFLYVAHECPHFPYQGPDDENKVVNADNWMEVDQRAYVAMLENLDSEVGRILDCLDQKGLSKNTIVVFASDNGGFAGAANMKPLSGAKGTTMEGGIRVPLVVRWPGQISPSVSDQVSLTFDLTKSFLNLAGADTNTLALDGIDILSHVANRDQDVDRTLFWRGKRGTKVWSAARDGDMKLVRKLQNGKREESLFDLSTDISESNNLIDSSANTAAKLRASLDQWESDMAERSKAL